MSAETRSPLNCRSKKIVVLFDGFAGRGADAALERAIGIFLGVLVQLPLHLNNLIRDHAVRLAMDLDSGFGVWRVAQPEDLPGLVLHPIFVFMRAVFVPRPRF